MGLESAAFPADTRDGGAEPTVFSADRRDGGARVAVEISRWLRVERATVTDDTGDRDEALTCELCGETVPAPVYREHVLKACPGR